jgi:hypothetical protein
MRWWLKYDLGIVLNKGSRTIFSFKIGRFKDTVLKGIVSRDFVACFLVSFDRSEV